MYNLLNISAQLKCRIFRHFCIIEFFSEWWTLRKGKLTVYTVHRCSPTNVLTNLWSLIEYSQFNVRSSGADPGFVFRRGRLRLLLYFNTNKPHSFFFLQNTSCIRKPQVISGAGGGVAAHPLHPPPRSAPGLPWAWATIFPARTLVKLRQIFLPFFF